MHHEFSAFASREGQLSSCTACLILWTPLFKGMLLPFSSHLNLQCLPARSFPSVWRHFISSNHKTPSFDLSAHSTSALFLSSHRRKTPWKLSSHSTYLFSPGHATISIHPLHFCESPQVSVLSYFPQEHLHHSLLTLSEILFSLGLQDVLFSYLLGSSPLFPTAISIGSWCAPGPQSLELFFQLLTSWVISFSLVALDSIFISAAYYFYFQSRRPNCFLG